MQCYFGMKKSRLSVSVIFRHEMTNRGILPAYGTIRTPRQWNPSHPGVQQMQRNELTVGWRGRPAQDLQGFRGLERTDDSGGGAKHAGLGAIGHDVRRRRFMKQAAITRRLSRPERQNLPLKTQNAAENERNAQKYGGIVRQELGPEIIGGFKDEVVAAQISGGVVRVQAVGNGLDFDFGVQLDQMPGRRDGLGLTHISAAVEDLALEVREVETIIVDDADVTDPGGSQVQQCRRPEASGTDDKDPGRLETFLSRAADLLKEDVPRVAAEFFPAKQNGLVVWE